MDQFGMETLQNSVILDVAGGSGELAFELANLNFCNVVSVDPRPMRLDRHIRTLMRGQRNDNNV